MPEHNSSSGAGTPNDITDEQIIQQNKFNQMYYQQQDTLTNITEELDSKEEESSNANITFHSKKKLSNVGGACPSRTSGT